MSSNEEDADARASNDEGKRTLIDSSFDDESSINVWADQPSHPPTLAHARTTSTPDPVGKVTAEFDEFDPFKPESSASDQKEGTNVGIQDKREAPLPETPTKVARSASSMPDNPAAGKESPSVHNNETIAPEMQQTPSMTALAKPLASIAAAFKRSAPSSPTPHTPSGSGPPAPVVLIKERDATDDIDESEKSAPPAIPTMSTSSNRRDSTDDDSEDQADYPPFDFNLFLEQMRSRSSDPIAKYLRSFLKEFGKRSWSVNDQIRVINDFLDFIAVKMRQNEVWKNNSEREFDNAVEAMEKLVMNRVYHLTFIPALTPEQQATTQTDDLERDHVLSQRIKLFGWVDEGHLDLPKTDDNDSFLEFAKQELLKVNTYKAPRDKLICILNACKVIFGLMRHLATEDGADTFIPFLILVVLRANPDHLISNIQYIQRFRNPERLAGENGYYLSSLNGAVSFIETMDSSSLSNINQEEFERRVEAAIAALPSDDAESHIPQYQQPAPIRKPAGTQAILQNQRPIPSSSSATPRPPDNPHGSSPGVQPATSFFPTSAEGEPQRSISPAEATREFFVRSSDNLQKTVSKPLQALSRIFTEMGSDSDVVAGVPRNSTYTNEQSRQNPYSHTHTHISVPRPPPPRRSSTNSSSATSPRGRRGYTLSAYPQPAIGEDGGVPQQPLVQSPRPQRVDLSGEDTVASRYQAADYLDDSVSAEQVQAEADRAHRANFNAKIDTLVNIFPGIEKETLEIVLLSNGENVERTIEGLLEMG